MNRTPLTEEELKKMAQESHASAARGQALKQRVLTAIREFLAGEPGGLLAQELTGTLDELSLQFSSLARVGLNDVESDLSRFLGPY